MITLLVVISMRYNKGELKKKTFLFAENGGAVQLMNNIEPFRDCRRTSLNSRLLQLIYGTCLGTSQIDESRYCWQL